MPKTRIKKKTNTTGGFQDLGYTLTEDEITKIGEIDNKAPKSHTHVKADITDFPTVNNGTLTIQKNGTKVQTFTANQSTNVIANITVPTKTSELTNDSGFITSDDLSSGVTSVVGQTGAVTADQIKSGIQNSTGGFSIGTNANASSGGAIGNTASAVTGGAVGKNSYAESGGAIGEYATTGSGGAVGDYSKSTTGGAIGEFAEATTGFAGGYNAKATSTGAVQLGEGTNATTNTLQFRGYQLLNASGKIPSERLDIDIPTKTSDLTNDSGFLTSAPVTSVAGNTGAVTVAQLVTAMLTGAVGYGDKITATDFTTSGKNYIKYQSGLMIQWGNTTLSSTTTTITFAPPFQSTKYTIVASKFTGTMSNALYWHAYKFVTQTTTNITIQKGFSETSEKIFWIAIGY